MMDIETLEESIMESIQDVPVGLHWKMIHLGMQGPVKLEDQVIALHIYVDEMDVAMVNPLLMVLYESHPSKEHIFPFNN